MLRARRASASLVVLLDSTCWLACCAASATSPRNSLSRFVAACVGPFPNLCKGAFSAVDREVSSGEHRAGHPHWEYQLASKRRASCCVDTKCATASDKMMESADIQLVSQSQATFSAPRLLSQKQTAAVEAAGSRVRLLECVVQTLACYRWLSSALRRRREQQRSSVLKCAMLLLT